MIVGLGNPGRTYEDTRHNAGFMVLDRLAARWGAVFKADRQRKCEVAAGPGVLLVKPSTFMNESGLCVGPMMRFFKLDPRSVFVIHDEVDFPLGVIKLREKGSAGGHNGIKSLIAHMGTQEFPRLRFGIGQPRGKGEMIGHVLGKFRPEERELLDVTLGKAEDPCCTPWNTALPGQAIFSTLFQADSRMKGRPICAMTHPWTGRRAFFPEDGAARAAG